MSTTASGAPASLPSSESTNTATPQQELTNFLTKASARYVPLPPLNYTCDAVFLHQWFESNLFAPSLNSQPEQTERIFELMAPEFLNTPVLGMKLLTVSRHREDPERFRLRWSRHDEDYSDIFLISFVGLANYVAVVPVDYMRRRYGDVRNIEDRFRLDLLRPSLFAPFMVCYQDLVKFLEDIYEHAYTSATSDLQNPTYKAILDNWKPELQDLSELMPIRGNLEKLWNMRDLYSAFRLSKETVRLSYRGEPGHFVIDGQAVEYWRKCWRRENFGNYIQISLLRQLSGESSWKFLFLEDYSGQQALFLPREMVPLHLIGHARHGRPGDNPHRLKVEVSAESLGPFLFEMRPAHSAARAIVSIIAKNTHQAEVDATHGLEDQGNGCLSLVPRSTRTETEDWT